MRLGFRSLLLLLAFGLASPATGLAQDRPSNQTRTKKKRKAKKRARQSQKRSRRKSTKKSRKRTRRPAKKVNRAGRFSQGRSRFSLNGGSTGNFGNQYIFIGAGYGYFIADGLEIGLDGSYFFGDDPSIGVLSPNTRYIFWQLDAITPYVGAFFERQFLGEYQGTDLDDIDSVGARGGIVYTAGRTFMTAGIAYAKVLDCEENTQVQLECERIIPEFGFGFSM
jgi:hypothetical protein